MEFTRPLTLATHQHDPPTRYPISTYSETPFISTALHYLHLFCLMYIPQLTLKIKSIPHTNLFYLFIYITHKFEFIYLAQI